jgi:hypothetical protein
MCPPRISRSRSQRALQSDVRIEVKNCFHSPHQIGTVAKQFVKSKFAESSVAAMARMTPVWSGRGAVSSANHEAPTASIASAKIHRMRYSADITAGSLKVAESRVVADLLLRNLTVKEWSTAIERNNALQARSTATAKRLARLLRQRLETMDEGLWRLIRDGSSVVATHACLAAAVKHSPLVGDFLDTVVREHYRTFASELSPRVWEAYLAECRSRDVEMPRWNDSTVTRLRSTVFHILAQAGYVESTRTLRLQSVHIASEVLRYLEERDERYVLRCIQVGP